MTRTLTGAVLAEVVKQKTRPILLIEMDFVSGFVRAWSGIGDLVWLSNTFLGTGDLMKISAVEETDEIRAAGLVIELSGVPSALLATALGEEYQGRAANVWVAFLDANYTLILDPILIWAAHMDVMEIDEGPETSIIRVQTESNLAALKRPKIRRLTDVDQQIDFPGDLGFEFIASLQDKQINF